MSVPNKAFKAKRSLNQVHRASVISISDKPTMRGECIILTAARADVSRRGRDAQN